MSYGNSTMHRRSVGSAVASPTTTTGGAGLTRSNNSDTAGSVHASPTRPSSSSATSHGSQPFIHDPLHARREIIELTDSDTETSAAPPPAAAASRISKNPISRVTAPPATNGSRNKKTSSLLQQQQQLQFQTTTPPTTTTHSASASPSIASLINPDTHAPLKKSKSTNPSPTNPYFPTGPTSTSAAPAAPESKKQKLSADAADKSPKSSKPGTSTNSSAPSPKPTRPAAPPPSSGNGLLSGVLSGNAPEPELKAPNIYLHVPLNGEQNKYVNFARLAEERYGWAALNPKLARAKQALHLDSGDEMMLDGSDTESNADTAGEKATEQGPKKRQKRSYQDIYDKADPFIDDSEMLWEEQAATSKDGFFVYSGPLVPEGQKPQIERADGTVKRGRGRGRGSRGGATSTRGTGTTARKPRITKKEKEKLEKEKEERERFSVLAAAQAGKPIVPPR